MSDSHAFRAALHTRCAHISTHAEGEAGSSLMLPIVQSSLFRLGQPDEADALFDGTRQGYAYTRFGNPTVDALASALALLEGGKDAVVTASGNAAVLTALLIARSGNPRPVLAHPDLYGGSCELLNLFAREFQIPVEWCDPRDRKAWHRAITRSSVVLIETPSNPLWRLIDIEATASLAHAAGAVLVVDNTVATPFNQSPLTLGADYVIHSTSKFLNGHSDMIGGCVISRESFRPEHRSIHKNIGATINAMDAWLILRGLRTFALRMEAHNRNAAAVAQWLHHRPEVSKVHHPSLSHEEEYTLFEQQMTGGCPVLSFELQDGDQAARDFLGKLKLVVHGVSLGGMESLATRPAATSHRGMSTHERRRAGISDGLVRLSVGTESLPDLLADLEQALSA